MRIRSCDSARRSTTERLYTISTSFWRCFIGRRQQQRGRVRLRTKPKNDKCRCAKSRSSAIHQRLTMLSVRCGVCMRRASANKDWRRYRRTDRQICTILIVCTGHLAHYSSVYDTSDAKHTASLAAIICRPCKLSSTVHGPAPLPHQLDCSASVRPFLYGPCAHAT